MAAKLVVLLFLLKTKYRRKWMWFAYWAAIVFGFLVCSTCAECDCVHGKCVDGLCVCDNGWQGDNCELCGGRLRLNSSRGIITDGLGNYSIDMQCSWLIDVGKPEDTIRLHLHQFSTECGWDYLYVFDGDSALQPLLAAFSGLLPGGDQKGKQRELVTHSGMAFLHFYSDAAYNMSGFNISYSVNTCPYDCSGNGVCLEGTCTCNAGWMGEDCAVNICPNNCTGGVCLREEHRCQCPFGMAGPDCSQKMGLGYWERVEAETNPLLGRVSHAAFAHNHSMWVFCGKRFAYEKYCDVHRFHFPSSTWQDLDSLGTRTHVRPLRRYGHSAVVFDNTALIYGGEVEDSVVTDDLWAYDMQRNTWYPMTRAPLPSVGHTAVMVGTSMVVMFGYSPVHGYLNVVQNFDLQSKTWQVVKSDDSVRGRFGHASVYDPKTEKVYVHGGYHSETSAGYELDDSLYAFDPFTKAWITMAKSGQKWYLHNAVLIDDFMLIFGGKKRKETSSSGAQCYNTDLMAYNVAKDAWIAVNTSTELLDDVARYGESAVIYDGSMYVFGGFNGQMLDDILRYSTGNCSLRTTEEDCWNPSVIPICEWDADGQSCDLVPTGRPLTSVVEELCKRQKNCKSCGAASHECVWCPKNKSCNFQSCNVPEQVAVSADECPEESQDCSSYQNCYLCLQDDDCDFEKSRGCYPILNGTARGQCDVPCSNLTSCLNCTRASCLWCGSEDRCIDSNAYTPSFPYGQCMQWTMQWTSCPAARCDDNMSCGRCLANPKCGWCNNKGQTGMGRCTQGSASGPLSVVSNQFVINSTMCPHLNWNFITCPECQCNGHSSCSHLPDQCDQCQNNTEGEHCEVCVDGYYGNPENGGTCKPCDCNNHATQCTEHGKCFCTTKGITGMHCDKCDEQAFYTGNPKDGGSCFYNLTTDFQFTFNLTKPEEKYYTQINFKNTPLKSESDTDFHITCSMEAFLNITYTTAGKPDEELILTNQSCRPIFKKMFSHTEYKFGPEGNTTFYVYVYDLQPPMWIQVAFSQYPKLDLLQFFITFSSCFLSLLVIAAILWKIKQKYDLYRRRQRLFVEMEQMASRPFASVFVEIEKKEENYSTINPVIIGSRKRKKERPSPIALEPCCGNRAAVLSLLVRLPTGDESYSPPGQAGIAVASALVTLGNPRKLSTETQKSDSKSKARKPFPHQHPDTCI